MVLDLKKQNEKIQRELEEKNRFINQIAISKNSLKVEEVAQIASKEGVKIGRNRLWEKLRGWGLIKQNSKYDPKQKYIDTGLFEVVEGARETQKGVFTYKTTKVTGKGQVYIIKKLLKEKDNE
nr:phage antirepressor KilAC domain-containing protein [Clostridium perfringens]